MMPKLNRTTIARFNRIKREPWSRSEITTIITTIVAVIGGIVGVGKFVIEDFHHQTSTSDKGKQNQIPGNTTPPDAPEVKPSPVSMSPTTRPEQPRSARSQQETELEDRLKTLAASIDDISEKCQKVSEENMKTLGISGELPFKVKEELNDLHLDEKAARHALYLGDLRTAKGKLADAESKLEPEANSPLNLCNE